MAFSRGGQFAVLAGPKSDGSEVHGVAILDVTDTVATSGREQSVASFALGSGLFEQRPGLRPLQVRPSPPITSLPSLQQSQQYQRLGPLCSGAMPEREAYRRLVLLLLTL